MRSRRLILALLAIPIATFARAADHGPEKSVYGYDLQGNAVRRLVASGTHAVVLFFLASDCPVSNRYAPEIARLGREFADRQVAVWLVYPNATETAGAVLQHAQAYALQLPTLLRASRSLLVETRVVITPSAAVLVADGPSMRTAYSGRIDDKYVDIGRERPKATRHDLEDAVEAILDQRPVGPPGGPPVGCGIVPEAALSK